MAWPRQPLRQWRDRVPVSKKDGVCLQIQHFASQPTDINRELTIVRDPNGPEPGTIVRQRALQGELRERALPLLRLRS